jgi:SpoVK/Ycf46/Vps4 family AAA+-type ATPase
VQRVLGKNKLEDIKPKSITRSYGVGDGEIEISILDALYGKLEGKEIMLDEGLVNKALEGVINAFKASNSKYNPIPRKIVIAHDESCFTAIDNKQEQALAEEKDSFIDAYEPRYSFDSVYMSEASRKQITTTLAMKKYENKLFNEWGLKASIKSGRAIVLNFFGPPGTGKSMTAEAIASYLGKEIYSVNYSQLESKYVGETPKNIKKAFDKAREKGAVLIFDEADSFLGKRLTNVNQSADYGVNITRSVMLLELEKFDGVVIFTTNLVRNYDEAFKRRILASIEFKLPDQAGRKAIWDIHLPKELPLEEGVNSAVLAERYQRTSGADIKDVLLFAAVMAADRQAGAVALSDFDYAYSYVMNRYSNGDNVQVKTELITEEQYNMEMSILDKELKAGGEVN